MSLFGGYHWKRGVGVKGGQGEDKVTLGITLSYI